MINTVDLYTDGACERNPGPGGYAYVLVVKFSDGRVAEAGGNKGFVRTTNNRMELMAVIAGLSRLDSRCEVTVYSDSKYVVNAINEGWLENWVKCNYKNGRMPNIDLWDQLRKLLAVHDVTFCWIKEHSGNKYNEMCDRMAVAARNGKAGALDWDYVYEQSQGYM